MSALKVRKLQRDYRSKGARRNIISRCDNSLLTTVKYKKQMGNKILNPPTNR